MKLFIIILLLFSFTLMRDLWLERESKKAIKYADKLVATGYDTFTDADYKRIFGDNVAAAKAEKASWVHYGKQEERETRRFAADRLSRRWILK